MLEADNIGTEIDCDAIPINEPTVGERWAGSQSVSLQGAAICNRRPFPTASAALFPFPEATMHGLPEMLPAIADDVLVGDCKSPLLGVRS